MIDVIEDVFNVEKLDEAIRELGNFELTMLNLTKYAIFWNRGDIFKQ